MNDERDELLREIGAALAIDPAPDFAASVRTEIAQVRPESRWRSPLLAGAVIAATSVVMGVLMFHHDSVRAPASPVHTLAHPAEQRVHTTRAETLPQPDPAGSTVKPTRLPLAGPRPIVATDEVQAFWRLVAAVQADELSLPPAGPPARDIAGDIGSLPEIAGIELPPITIEPLRGTETDDKVGGTDD